MCKGDSGRASEGGTITILRPLNSSVGGCNGDSTAELLMGDEVRLRITARSNSNSSSNGSSGDASHIGQAMVHMVGLRDGTQGGQVIIIHRDGDLRSKSVSERNVLHRFAVPSALRGDTSFCPGAAIDIGVGEKGIIGRRVSLLHSSGGGIIGQGIVGWN